MPRAGNAPFIRLHSNKTYHFEKALCEVAALDGKDGTALEANRKIGDEEVKNDDWDDTTKTVARMAVVTVWLLLTAINRNVNIMPTEKEQDVWLPLLTNHCSGRV